MNVYESSTNKKNESDVIRVCVWGNFEFYENLKGIQILLQNFPNDNNKITLEVAGIGLKRVSVDSESSTVKICGYKSNVIEWIQGSDILIIPAVDTNGVKIKLLEAIASGKKVFILNKVVRHLCNPNELNNSNICCISNFSNIKGDILETRKIYNSIKFDISWNNHYSNISSLL
jgi:glycosyltransferase involved in cell wall biosynthesis